MNKSKYILVTGGAGYIGSHTVVELIKNGYTPVILDDFRNAQETSINGINAITGQDVIVRKVDVCDLLKLKAVFNEFDFEGIIHFAAYKAVGESVEKPLSYYRNNIMGLVNCLDLAIEKGVENFVFSSSCTVYGEPENSKVVNENSPIQKANSPYGNTKQVGEEIIEDVVTSGAPIRVLNLRYFNPVGAHSSALIGEFPIGKPNNLLPVITQNGVGKLNGMTVNGNDYDTVDGTCVRDYIHVSDVANAHVKGMDWLIANDGFFAENINIGTGRGTSILELINIFENVSGTKLNWKYAARRSGDVVEIYADVTKAKQILNWQSQLSVNDAVRDSWNWELKLKND